MKKFIASFILIFSHIVLFAGTSLTEQRTAASAADGLSKCQAFFSNDTVNSCSTNGESRTAGCSGCAKPGAGGTSTYYCQATENLYSQVNGTGSCNNLIQSTIVAWTYPSVACPAGTTFVGPIASDCIPTGFVQAVSENMKANVNSDPAIGCSSTNPCHIGTGNYSITEVDFVGEENIPSFVRTYNSLIQDDFADIGMGWRHNHSMRLELKAGRVIRMHRGDGQILTFNKVGTNWVGDADSRYQLSADATGYSVSIQNGVVERYNLNGYIMTSTSVAGLVTTYSYNGNQLLTVTGPFGQQLQFLWYSNEVAKVTMPDGSIYTYGINSLSNNVAGVTYPDGTKKTYLYENTLFPYSITGVLDTNGTKVAVIKYEASTGKVASIERANGVEHFDIQYAGMTTTVTDPLGNITTAELSNILGVKYVSKLTNMSDGSFAFTVFDTRGNVLAYTNENGVVTNYTYDSANRLLGMTLAAGSAEERAIGFTYADVWLSKISTLTEPSVNVGSTKQTVICYGDSRFTNLPTGITVNGFDSNGVAISKSKTITYNSSGQPSTVGTSGSAFNDIEYTYKLCITGAGCGKVSSINTPAGNILYMYDAKGVLVTTTGIDGISKTFNPDGSIDVTGKIQSSYSLSTSTAPKITITPDTKSRSLKVTNIVGRAITYFYDANGRTTKVIDPIGNYKNYTYDPIGNLTGLNLFDVSNVAERSVSSSFDKKGNVSSVSYGQRQYAYSSDLVGNVVGTTNPNGQISSFSFDALNRKTKVINEANGVTNITYSNSDVKSVTAPNGSSWQFYYDDLGNIEKLHSSDSGLVARTFDNHGNVLTSTDARNITKSFTYDNAGRIRNIGYPSPGEDVSISWITGVQQANGLTSPVANGNPDTVNEVNGTRYYRYCSFGFTCEATLVTKNNVKFTFLNNFDDDGKIYSTTYPSGKITSYMHDTNGRVNGILYNGQALMTGRTFASDGSVLTSGLVPVNSQTNYDASGLPTSLNIGGAYSATYSRDLNGNVLNDGIDSFSYDAMDQIISTNSSSVAYDENGNRTSDSNGMYGYQSNSNQLNSTPFGAVSIDLAGNVNQIGQRSFTFNQAGRLASVSVNGAVVGTYTYDYLGRRASKTVNGQTTLFHYGVNNEMLSETKDDGTPLVDYVYDDRLTPVAQIRSGVVTVIHADSNGTPILGTDLSGNVVWKWDGNTSPANAPNINVATINLRYAGQYYDQESGLHQNWFRDYDPLTGKYIEPDPIGIKGGLNSYTYAGNNNISNTDPYGLFEFISTSRNKDGAPTGFIYTNGVNTNANNAYNCTYAECASSYLLGMKQGVKSYFKGLLYDLPVHSLEVNGFFGTERQNNALEADQVVIDVLNLIIKNPTESFRIACIACMNLTHSQILNLQGRLGARLATAGVISALSSGVGFAASAAAITGNLTSAGVNLKDQGAVIRNILFGDSK